MRRVRLVLAAVLVAVLAVAAPAVLGAAEPEPPVLDATVARTYDAPDANQGVAVDRDRFFGVDNARITAHDRRSGAARRQVDGPLIHLDSGAVIGRQLVAAHSNYDTSPMTSSVEVFDARSLRHVATHSFGIDRGSLTWVDRHDGSWWAGFANYDKVPDGATAPYGGTDNTQVVRLDDEFRVQEAWTIPKAILDRFRPMSNSGGSWGPDGRLWLTGHDLGEAYVMELPRAGSELRWVATVRLPGVEGQGIAWDRSSKRPTLWAIGRSTRQVLQLDVPWQRIPATPAPDFVVSSPASP